LFTRLSRCLDFYFLLPVSITCLILFCLPFRFLVHSLMTSSKPTLVMTSASKPTIVETAAKTTSGSGSGTKVAAAKAQAAPQQKVATSQQKMPALQQNLVAPQQKIAAKTPSKAIQIASPRHNNIQRPKEKQMAHSCPAPSRPPPPPAPSSRPRVPTMDPPLFVLPPSPPVFSDSQVQKAKSDARKAVSRSLSTYSSSCPPDSFLLSVMGEEKEDTSESILGKSPTIFSLMKSDNGSSFSFGGTNSTYMNSAMRGSMNSSSSGSSSGRKDDIDSDDLQFAISLNDDSLLESESDGFLLF